MNLLPIRSGKSLVQELMLQLILIDRLKDGVPSQPLKLLVKGEIITWLPTGEVISRRA